MARVYEALAEMLVAEGVETVFGLIGGGVDNLTHLLVSRHSVRFVPTRHEEAAVGAADGYYRSTGKIGVAIVAYGPGIAKVGATLIAAQMANSSVLVICGETHDRLNPMNFDQHPFILATAGTIQTVHGPDQLAEDVQLVFRHLRLGKGPIVLNLTPSSAPYDPPTDRPYDANGLSKVIARPAIPQPEEMAAIAQLLDQSARPILLAGRGAVLACAKESLIALAEKTGAVLTTSLLAKDWFRGHPRNIGLVGSLASPCTVAMLGEADLIVAFGARLNQNTTLQGNLFPKATLVQIDHDPARIGDITPVHAGAIADAGLAAAALLAASCRARPDGWGGAATEERIAAIDHWEGLDCTETLGCLNPVIAARVLEEMLPTNRQLVIDIGQFMRLPATFVSVADPLDLVFPWQLGIMGTGLSVAIGAAVAKPEKRTVLICGDGGIMASLNDLDTVARCNVPLTIIVMDDEGFGAERRLFEMNDYATTTSDYQSPDIAGAARALGLDGYFAANKEALCDVLQAVNHRGRPALVQVRASRETRLYEMLRTRGM